jgi:enamine deaminase RidA (YjgF/YER057c/UK114 family)
LPEGQRIVRAQDVFPTGMEALEAHNDLRVTFYVDGGSAPPASTWIGCTRLAAPGLMLEVECIAVLG